MCWLLQGQIIGSTERSRLRPKTHGGTRCREGTRREEMNRTQQSPVTTLADPWSTLHLAGRVRQQAHPEALSSKVCMRTPGRQEEHRGTKLRVPFGGLSRKVPQQPTLEDWELPEAGSQTGLLYSQGPLAKHGPYKVKPSSLHSPSRRTEPDQCHPRKRKYFVSFN